MIRNYFWVPSHGFTVNADPLISGPDTTFFGAALCTINKSCGC